MWRAEKLRLTLYRSTVDEDFDVPDDEIDWENATIKTVKDPLPIEILSLRAQLAYEHLETFNMKTGLIFKVANTIAHMSEATQNANRWNCPNIDPKEYCVFLKHSCGPN